MLRDGESTWKPLVRANLDGDCDLHAAVATGVGVPGEDGRAWFAVTATNPLCVSRLFSSSDWPRGQ
jgi:hypothetical protein